MCARVFEFRVMVVSHNEIAYLSRGICVCDALGVVFHNARFCFQLFVSHCPIQYGSKSLELRVFVVLCCTLQHGSWSEFTANCRHVLFVDACAIPSCAESSFSLPRTTPLPPRRLLHAGMADLT